MDEFVAGPGERQGRFGLAHPQHKHILLAQAHGKPGKVRITGDQAESLNLVFIENIHGIDDHGHIRGIFSGGIGKLLHRHNGMLQQ